MDARRPFSLACAVHRLRGWIQWLQLPSKSSSRAAEALWHARLWTFSGAGAPPSKAPCACACAWHLPSLVRRRNLRLGPVRAEQSRAATSSFPFLFAPLSICETNNLQPPTVVWLRLITAVPSFRTLPLRKCVLACFFGLSFVCFLGLALDLGFALVAPKCVFAPATYPCLTTKDSTLASHDIEHGFGDALLFAPWSYIELHDSIITNLELRNLPSNVLIQTNT